MRLGHGPRPHDTRPSSFVSTHLQPATRPRPLCPPPLLSPLASPTPFRPSPLLLLLSLLTLSRTDHPAWAALSRRFLRIDVIGLFALCAPSVSAPGDGSFARLSGNDPNGVASRRSTLCTLCSSRITLGAGTPSRMIRATLAGRIWKESREISMPTIIDPIIPDFLDGCHSVGCLKKETIMGVLCCRTLRKIVSVSKFCNENF